MFVLFFRVNKDPTTELERVQSSPTAALASSATSESSSSAATQLSQASNATSVSSFTSLSVQVCVSDRLCDLFEI